MNLIQYPFLDRKSVSCAAVVFALTLAAYSSTLLPGPVGGDAGELQYAGPLLALVHPTGQPLYVVLGYLWSHLIPIGSFAYRMNLLAAVSAATACAVVAAALVRLYGNWGIGLGGGLALGFGATFWSQAVIADKYAFGALLAAIVVGLALMWVNARAGLWGDRWLYALCLAYGLCLLHHRSLFLFGPGLALLVVLAERTHLWRRPRRTATCLALAFGPALIGYPLLLPWLQARNLSPLNWQPQTAAGWLDWWLERHILAGYALSFGASPTSTFGERLLFYAQTLGRDHTVVVPLGALIGVGLTLRRRPTLGAFLVVSFALTAAFAANFRGNQHQFTIFYLPSFVVLIYSCGIGFGEIGRWLDGRPAVRRWPGWAKTLVVAAPLLIVSAFQFGQGYEARRLDATFGAPLDIWRQVLKTGTLGERLARGLEELPANAVVIGDWEQITILWYYQRVEGRRPDLELVYPIERLADYGQGNRPICLARSAPLGAEWRVSNIGALACLTRQRPEPPTDVVPVGAVLQTSAGQPVLELLGYRPLATTVRRGSHAPLTLVWRAIGEDRQDYQVSLHILDEQWRQLWASDGGPVLGMYPTSRWAAGEVVQDYRELTVEPTLPSGRYLWTVVLYRQLADGGFEHLRDPAGNVEILGGTFEVRR